MPIIAQPSVEIARFIVGGPTPEQIIAFRPFPEATERFYALINAERLGTITDEERTELDSCVSLEHMMRLVKIEAHHAVTQHLEQINSALAFVYDACSSAPLL